MKTGFGMTSRGYRNRGSDGRGDGAPGRGPRPGRSADRPYSFLAAVKYTFVLSLLLWWLPIFGQMISGYVGGRKAGSPNMGMLAALIPVGAFTALIYAIETGTIAPIDFINGSNAALLDAFSAELPALGAMMGATVAYMDSFMAAVGSTTSLNINSYIITIVFAYVGGILSEQGRREMDYVRQHAPPASKAQGRPSFESFDECTPVKGKAVRQTPKAEPRRRPAPAVAANAFNGLLHRAEVNDPNRDRGQGRKGREDFEYV